MRFALLGDHPDGLGMARALVESGRHELAVYAGPVGGVEQLARWNLRPARGMDTEDVVSRADVAAVIVAVAPAHRPPVLRRALQSEHHVLCVHPLDRRPDTAYEAGMIQAETKRLLFPLLPYTLHPGIAALAALLRQSPPLGLIDMEFWAEETVLLDGDVADHKSALPGWDVLRFLGGVIAEVMALAETEEMSADQPLLVTGRFERGGLFRAAFLPRQAHDAWRLSAFASQGPAVLLFPEGWPGPARLTFTDDTGRERTEAWEAWNPWPALVEAFEAALLEEVSAPAAGGVKREHAVVAGLTDHSIMEATPAHAVAALPGASAKRAATAHAITATPGHPGNPASGLPSRMPSWRDAIRCLELDEAARRSVARRRASTLDNQEATEEASFKGAMTLMGCGMLWISVVLLILSVWVPWLGWLIVPVFGLFLVLQAFRWVVPATPDKAEPQRAQRDAET